uniref:Uncharacterized protein n=1 Tax=uncultured prokaryote TaxID=198431 RepID=A0A0H5Q4B2_9ZZZZ|nr:hypothetical protein [uncultured prokaryote]
MISAKTYTAMEVEKTALDAFFSEPYPNYIFFIKIALQGAESVRSTPISLFKAKKNLDFGFFGP